MSSSIDPFDELEVTPSDSDEAIRASFLRLQKLHHPDVAGPAGAERSVRLNVAYDLLSPAKRGSLSSRAAKSGAATPRPRESGLVGPLREEIVLEETGSYSEWISFAELRDTLTEFFKTMPLQVPLMIDETLSGLRIAFCTSSAGRLESLGELEISFHEVDEQSWRVSVLRRQPLAMKAGTPLPGEQRLLQSLRRELAAALREGGVEKGGIVLPG